MSQSNMSRHTQTDTYERMVKDPEFRKQVVSAANASNAPMPPKPPRRRTPLIR